MAKAKSGGKICPKGIAWAKRTFDKYLPHEITHRSKRGFSIPLKKWSNLLDGKETKQEKILAEFNLDVK